MPTFANVGQCSPIFAVAAKNHNKHRRQTTLSNIALKSFANKCFNRSDSNLYETKQTDHKPAKHLHEFKLNQYKYHHITGNCALQQYAGIPAALGEMTQRSPVLSFFGTEARSPVHTPVRADTLPIAALSLNARTRMTPGRRRPPSPR